MNSAKIPLIAQINMLDLQKLGTTLDTEAYAALVEESDVFLAQSAEFLWNTLLVSFIHLLFPINIIMEKFFIIQTKRKATDWGINFFNQLALFIIIVWLLNDWIKYNGFIDPEIEFMHKDMTD